MSPDFFDDEDLVRLSPYARLAFEGLWCLADREGRLEDRPQMLKLKLLPFDEVDMDEILDELATPRRNVPGSFVLRYEIDGRRYISIPNFHKHQKPHKNEAPSKIPPPPLEKFRDISRNAAPIRYTDPVSVPDPVHEHLAAMGGSGGDPTQASAATPPPTRVEENRENGSRRNTPAGTTEPERNTRTGTQEPEEKSDSDAAPRRNSSRFWWDSENRRVWGTEEAREKIRSKWLARGLSPEEFQSQLRQLDRWLEDRPGKRRKGTNLANRINNWLNKYLASREERETV